MVFHGACQKVEEIVLNWFRLDCFVEVVGLVLCFVTGKGVRWLGLPVGRACRILVTSLGSWE